MKVELLHHTPLWVASRAIRKCWASEDKSDSHFEKIGDEFDYEEVYVTGEKDRELIERVGNKNKHSSTLEHLNYSFDIDGISRACLQELARHRHTSLSVQSSRYTLQKILNKSIESWDCYVPTGNDEIDDAIENQLTILANLSGSNDLVKYALPEAFKTSLVWTINARSLQNFLLLRTDKSALWEIRDLANKIFNQLPEEHKYLFVDFMKEA